MEPQDVFPTDNDEPSTIMTSIKRRASWFIRETQPPKPINTTSRRRVSITPNTPFTLQVITEDTQL